MVILASTLFFNVSLNIRERVEARNPTPIFYVPFEQTVSPQIAGNSNPQNPQGINYVDDGIRGSALSISTANYHLAYLKTGNFPGSGGTVEFWVRLREQIDQNLVYFQESGGNDIKISQWNYWDGSLMKIEFGGGTGQGGAGGMAPATDVVDAACNRDWKGGWHQFAFTWSASVLDGYSVSTRTYIDGYFEPTGDNFHYAPHPNTPLSEFSVGSVGLPADIDELKIYDTALTEEEIHKNYVTLFPFEYYAKETVLTNSSLTQTVDVNITKIRRGFLPPNITGTFMGQVDGQASNTRSGLNLFEGDNATLSVSLVAPVTGEYNLTCSFIPDGSQTQRRYDRIIKLFAIDGQPRPSRDNLYLKPIVSINCADKTNTTYAGYSNTYTTTDIGLVRNWQQSSETDLADWYADTGDATIGQIGNVQYRQSGAGGAAGYLSAGPYYNSTAYEDVPTTASYYSPPFELPGNAKQPDNTFAVANNFNASIYRNFGFPSVPSGAKIGIQVRLDAKAVGGGGNAYGYLIMNLSWNGGVSWTNKNMEISLKADAPMVSQTLGPGDWGHDWSPLELDDSNFRILITSDAWQPDTIELDWITVKVYHYYPLPSDPTKVGYFSRFAFKFNIQNLNSPHVVVVTYPDDKERTMGIDLCSYNDVMSGRVQSIQTGIFTGGEYACTNGFKQHTIFFWPRNTTYMITLMNWQTYSAGAAASRIDVYEIEGDEQTGWFPKTEVITPPGGGRLLGLWWEDASFFECFGVRHYSLQELYRATLNAMDYLHFTGQNLIVYPVWQYWRPQYPSRVERNIQTYQSVEYCHLYPYDWFELLLKVAKANDVNVVASLDIGCTPSLDMANDYSASAIKSAVLATIGDILEQYGNYSNFKGISLFLEQYIFPRLPNIMYRLKLAGENINQPGGLLLQISEEIRQFNQQIRQPAGYGDLKLIASCLGVQAWDGYVDDWYNSPSRPQFVYQNYTDAGLDLIQLKQQDGTIRTERVIQIALYRQRLTGGQTSGPPDNALRSLDFLADYDSCYEPFLKQDDTAAAIYNGYFEAHVKADGIPLTPNWGLEKDFHGASITPGHIYFMRDYTRLVTYLDPVQISDGGLIVGTIGHELQMQDFAKAFRALPAKTFDTVTHAYMDKVQVRSLREGDKFYFYLVNNMSYPVRVKLTFSKGASFILDLVEGVGVADTLQEYTVTLEPYELRSYSIEDPDLKNPVTITGVGMMKEDVNADGKINIIDITIAARAFASRSGEPRWDERADINSDGVINIIDIAAIARQFGKTF